MGPGYNQKASTASPTRQGPRKQTKGEHSSAWRAQRRQEKKQSSYHNIRRAQLRLASPAAPTATKTRLGRALLRLGNPAAPAWGWNSKDLMRRALLRLTLDDTSSVVSCIPAARGRAPPRHRSGDGSKWPFPFPRKLPDAILRRRTSHDLLLRRQLPEGNRCPRKVVPKGGRVFDVRK